jgi:hypothetical protein
VDSTDDQIGMNQLLGLFDLPAFARRGQDLEYALARMDKYCRRVRLETLEMVHLRLRQWSSAVTGPEAWSGVFTAPIVELWDLCAAEAPQWAVELAPMRRQRAIARDLVGSLVRFNRRWATFLDNLNVDHLNRAIDAYNLYYTLEKECVLGSARLAARHFKPREPVTRDSLAREYPPLPVPGLIE